MGSRPKRSAVFSWITYDIGNTLFYTGVVGIFFPLWVTETTAGDDSTIGFTMAIAMAVLLLIGPFMGTFSDYGRRRKPFLALGTYLCISATFFLGDSNLTIALVLFGLAIIGESTANIFYNALLADVSTGSNRGVISGLGVGIGYLGSIAAVAIGLIIVQSWGYAAGFRAVSVLFLVVSLPLMVFLKENAKYNPDMSVWDSMSWTLRRLRNTARDVKRFPGVSRFLFARFWYMWGVNTGITFAVLYATGTVGLSIRTVQWILLAGILIAIPSALIWGVIVDKIGPKRTLGVVLMGWMLVLSFAFALPVLGLPRYLWWIFGLLTGTLIAGVWVADRPYMIQLVPENYLGEFFGLHGMVTRLSTMVGPFTWGVIVDKIGLGRPAAILSLLGCIVISYVLIRGMPETSRAKELRS
jgi:UMF1 family MFS transporter